MTKTKPVKGVKHLGKTPMNIRIAPELALKVRALARAQHRTVSAQLEYILSEIPSLEV
jgi:hypothetical protein